METPRIQLELDKTYITFSGDIVKAIEILISGRMKCRLVKVNRPQWLQLMLRNQSEIGSGQHLGDDIIYAGDGKYHGQEGSPCAMHILREADMDDILITDKLSCPYCGSTYIGQVTVRVNNEPQTVPGGSSHGDIEGAPAT